MGQKTRATKVSKQTGAVGSRKVRMNPLEKALLGNSTGMIRSFESHMEKINRKQRRAA